MKQAIDVVMAYAGAFEQTYLDDDWSRLAPFFSEDALYEVRGGPMACRISGREAIFVGLKKSVDGLDRRCDKRMIEVTDGPTVVAKDEGEELSIAWRASYQYGDAPQGGFAGRSVALVVDGLITSLRDEYDEEEMGRFGEWMAEYGQGLDGSYI